MQLPTVLRAAVVVALALAGLAFAGCSEPPTAPRAGAGPTSPIAWRDVVRGRGAELGAGQLATVRRTITLSSGRPLVDGDEQFVTGDSRAMRGLDLGVRGMRVGGRRQFMVPPEYGYPTWAFYPELPPDPIFLVDVTLLAVEEWPAPTRASLNP